MSTDEALRGFPFRYRGSLWARILGADQAMEKNPGVYEALVQQTQPDKGIVEKIDRDIPRTYPFDPYFSDECDGKSNLRIILTAFSCINSRIRYCQGLNYVAATLLLEHTTNIEVVFWMLVSFVEGHYPDMFISGLPMLNRMLGQLEESLNKHSPLLRDHFDEESIDVRMFANSWFISAYSATFPRHAVQRVWDVFLLEGQSFLVAFANALLMLNEEALLSASAEEILSYLQSSDVLAPGLDKLINKAYQLLIGNQTAHGKKR